MIKKKIESIFKELCVVGKDDVYIEDLLADNRIFRLDIYPKRIVDDEKYKQVELFYQKVIDDDVDEWVFEKYEDGLHFIIKTLWLYSPVYVGLYSAMDKISDSDYYMYNVDKISDFCNEISEISNLSAGRFEAECCLVEDFELLQALMYCGTREIADMLLYFEKFKLAIYISGIQGQCLSVNSEATALLQKIATANGFYIW